MAYQDETYVKMNLIHGIRELAAKLELTLWFDNPEEIAYGDLVALRDDLLAQYNNKFFVENYIREISPR
jgi:hypothetical protein